MKRLAKKAKLSKRLAVEMAYSSNGLTCQWPHGFPKASTHTKIRAYYKERDNFMVEIAKEIVAALASVLTVA